MSFGLQEGAVFAGRYRIVRRIAAGGMGAVYEVVHLETDRRRALKVMHAHILQNDEMRERFKREAKVAAHIESDFIVDVFDAGVDDATQMPFLVMELLRGEELGKRLKRLGRLPPEEVLLHLHQTAVALDKTHKAFIVHRDLKPENLFLSEREDSAPRIKVLDFGIAKIVAENATSGGTTMSIGTPLYMSPEQFNPAAKLTGAADIYALGMIAYTLLVGESYWANEARTGNLYAVAAIAIHGPPQPASVRAAAHGVALPPSFDRWFAQMTAVDPAQRFPSASTSVRGLAQVLGAPVPGTHSADPVASQRSPRPQSPPWTAPPEPYAARGTIPMADPGRPYAPPPVVAPPVLPAPDAAPPSTAAPGAAARARARSAGVFVAAGLLCAAAAVGLSSLRSRGVPSPPPAPPGPTMSSSSAPPEAPPPSATASTPVPVVESAAPVEPGPPESAPEPTSPPDSQSPPARQGPDKPAPSTSPSSVVSGKASLNMNSIPVSRVLLDGKPLGSTPRMGVAVSAGSHTVTFIHADRGWKTVTVTVKAGETKTAAVKF